MRPLTLPPDTRLAFSVAAAWLLGAAAAAGQEYAPAPGPPLQASETAIIQGLAVPSQQVTLAPSMDGVLLRVLVREGQFVKEGELVAVMDNRLATSAVGVAQVTAAQHGQTDFATFDLHLAETMLVRIQSVDETGAVAEAERDEARARRDKAKANLDKALEQHNEALRKLELEKTRLEMHNLRAPFAGYVLRIDGVPGRMLTRSDPVVTLVNMDELRAELLLPATMYGKLDVGLTYTLVATTPAARKLQARLVFVEPMIDPASQLVRFVFLVDNRKDRMPAGFPVHLDATALQSRAGQRSQDPPARLVDHPKQVVHPTTKSRNRNRR